MTPTENRAVEEAETEKDAFNRASRTAFAVCAALFLLLLSLVVSMPMQLYGDGLEYLTMASSMLYSHDLVFQKKDVRTAALRVPEATYVQDRRTGQHTRVSARTGERVYGTHSFYYSLLALPLFALFGARGFLVRPRRRDLRAVQMHR